MHINYTTLSGLNFILKTNFIKCGIIDGFWYNTNSSLYIYLDILKIFLLDFSLKKFSAGAIFYDEQDITKLNRKVISNYGYADIAKKLADLDIKVPSAEQYEVISENLANYYDIAVWHKVLEDFSSAEFSVEDQEFLKICADLLVDISTDKFLPEWVANISERTGRKGRGIYHPIRLALTNMEDGPELKKIIPLLGLAEVKKRLGANG